MSGAGAGDGAGQASVPRHRFRPAPRSGGRASATRRHEVANIRAELESIGARTALVVVSDRGGFHDGSVTYDAASMAVIRLAALLDRPEVDAVAQGVLSAEERAAIRTTRDIVAHAGYRDMNDDLLWLAATRRLPDILRRLTTAWEGHSSADEPDV